MKAWFHGSTSQDSSRDDRGATDAADRSVDVTTRTRPERRTRRRRSFSCSLVGVPLPPRDRDRLPRYRRGPDYCRLHRAMVRARRAAARTRGHAHLLRHRNRDGRWEDAEVTVDRLARRRRKGSGRDVKSEPAQGAPQDTELTGLPGLAPDPTLVWPLLRSAAVGVGSGRSRPPGSPVPAGRAIECVCGRHASGRLLGNG